jgi:hypothetical protein
MLNVGKHYESLMFGFLRTDEWEVCYDYPKINAWPGNGKETLLASILRP